MQKVRVRISPNDSDIVFRQVLVVSGNEPPRAGATNSEEAARIQANARPAQQREEEQRRVALPCVVSCTCVPVFFCAVSCRADSSRMMVIKECFMFSGYFSFSNRLFSS